MVGSIAKLLYLVPKQADEFSPKLQLIQEWRLETQLEIAIEAENLEFMPQLTP